MRKKLFTFFALLFFLSASLYAMALETKFGASDLDESDPIDKYYAFTYSTSEDWYILKISSDIALRYIGGRGNYEAAWSSRTILNYRYRYDMYK